MSGGKLDTFTLPREILCNSQKHILFQVVKKFPCFTQQDGSLVLALNIHLNITTMELKNKKYKVMRGIIAGNKNYPFPYHLKETVSRCHRSLLVECKSV